MGAATEMIWWTTSLMVWASIVLTVPMEQCAAQSRPDFSGRWYLIGPAEGYDGSAPMPEGMAAEELIVSHDATFITVEHRRTPSRHPKAATHRLGSAGTVGSAGQESGTHVFWFGSQLIISTTSTGSPDAEGRRRSYGYEEMWSLDHDGRLVISSSQRPSEGISERVMLVYEKR